MDWSPAIDEFAWRIRNQSTIAHVLSVAPIKAISTIIARCLRRQIPHRAFLGHDPENTKTIEQYLKVKNVDVR